MGACNVRPWRCGGLGGARRQRLRGRGGSGAAAVRRLCSRRLCRAAEEVRGSSGAAERRRGDSGGRCGAAVVRRCSNCVVGQRRCDGMWQLQVEHVLGSSCSLGAGGCPLQPGQKQRQHLLCGSGVECSQGLARASPRWAHKLRDKRAASRQNTAEQGDVADGARAGSGSSVTCWLAAFGTGDARPGQLKAPRAQLCYVSGGDVYVPAENTVHHNATKRMAEPCHAGEAPSASGLQLKGTIDQT